MAENWLIQQRKTAAGKIPVEVRRIILENNYIDVARPFQEYGTPFEYLFDVYMEFIDRNSHFNDYGCSNCREHILQEWKLLKQHLEDLEHGKA